MEPLSAQLSRSLLSTSESMRKLEEELERVSLGQSDSDEEREGGGRRRDGKVVRRRRRRRRRDGEKGKAASREEKGGGGGGGKREVSGERKSRAGEGVRRRENLELRPMEVFLVPPVRPSKNFPSEAVDVDRPSSLASSVSSRFDSAIGSLQSQTDEDSFGSQPTTPLGKMAMQSHRRTSEILQRSLPIGAHPQPHSTRRSSSHRHHRSSESESPLRSRPRGEGNSRRKSSTHIPPVHHDRAFAESLQLIQTRAYAKLGRPSPVCGQAPSHHRVSVSTATQNDGSSKKTAVATHRQTKATRESVGLHTVPWETREMETVQYAVPVLVGMEEEGDRRYSTAKELPTPLNSSSSGSTIVAEDSQVGDNGTHSSHPVSSRHKRPSQTSVSTAVHSRHSDTSTADSYQQILTKTPSRSLSPLSSTSSTTASFFPEEMAATSTPTNSLRLAGAWKRVPRSVDSLRDEGAPESPGNRKGRAKRKAQARLNDSPAQPVGTRIRKGLSRRLEMEEGSEGAERWSTRFYHENLTPQSSPNLPRRYMPFPAPPHKYPREESGLVSTTSGPVGLYAYDKKERMPLKRRGSLLQRLRSRRRGSFRRERRRKRSPVKRSHSDRVTGDDWVDYEEDLNPISAPSLPRSIGRMVDTLAGKIHVVELHRPPNGKYGIYITEGEEGGVFVSRFADQIAQKFYAGLLNPRDELITINGEAVREKSLDYVYDLLAGLDTVVLTVIPIGSRPDW